MAIYGQENTEGGRRQRLTLSWQEGWGSCDGDFYPCHLVSSQCKEPAGPGPSLGVNESLACHSQCDFATDFPVKLGQGHTEMGTAWSGPQFLCLYNEELPLGAL